MPARALADEQKMKHTKKEGAGALVPAYPSALQPLWLRGEIAGVAAIRGEFVAAIAENRVVAGAAASPVATVSVLDVDLVVSLPTNITKAIRFTLYSYLCPCSSLAYSSI